MVYVGFTSHSSKMNLHRLTVVDSSYDPHTHYPGICCTYRIGETRSIEKILGKQIHGITWDILFLQFFLYECIAPEVHLKSENILIVFTIESNLCPIKGLGRTIMKMNLIAHIELQNVFKK